MEQRVKRALVSVYRKEGIVKFCRGLAALDIEILSSGGTAHLLDTNGIRVTRVSDYTGFPEMLGGRVKTLHPKIHGGILAIRDNAEHMGHLDEHGILAIDLVVVNLYPFGDTITDPGTTLSGAVEMIDIGGPSMVRGAAKNYRHVGVVVAPDDYTAVLDELKAQGGLSDATRLRLSAAAFDHTARYDTAIAGYLAEKAGTQTGVCYPDVFSLELTKVQDMRYGENPHQTAAFYRDPGSDLPTVANAGQLQGKELSFNNILDLDAALAVAAAFDSTACAVIKHGNPCGAALGTDVAAAFRDALACDPVSAFGGVIAFNRPVDEEVATAIKGAFYEAVIAPGFSDGALKALKKKKNLRLLATGELSGYRRDGHDLRRVAGGLLVQEWDTQGEVVRECQVAGSRQPTEEEWQALEFGWVVGQFVKSNAIVYARPGRTVGIGAGQMSRVDSARFGALKALSSLEGAVMASDAFFPFRDGIDAAHEAGITAVIQPGGSIRDEEVVKAADEHGMAMVLTGRRHFRH